ncbi:MAG: serine/threonine-protein kinase [Planctomycetota bacterium]|jgi:hypothetical protein
MSEEPRDEAFHFAGDRLGKFVILGELGRGSMGVVYEAFQEDLKRKVALKVLPANIALDVKQVRRFKREAESIAQLRHDHVIQIYEVGQIENTHYFAMELVDGAGFASESFLRDRDFIDDAARIARDAARGLAHAHERGVIHRDIKPSNLLVDRGKRVVVSDFGLARLTESGSLTSTDAIVGTPKYMAPEQILPGTYPLDGRCDIYGLGATLYEAVCGNPPVEAPSVQAFLRAILEDRPTWPRKRNRLVPHDLSTIIMRCLEKHPSDRYANADALADDLERFLNGERIVAKPKGLAARGVGFMLRHKVVSALSLVVFIGLVVTLVLTFQVQTKAEIARLLNAADDELPAAIKEAEELQRSHPRDEAVKAVLSRLLSRQATVLLESRQDTIRDHFPMILDLLERAGGRPGFWRLMLLFECDRAAEARQLIERLELPEPIEALVRARLALLAGEYDTALKALANAPPVSAPAAQRVFHSLIRASAERALEKYIDASRTLDGARELSANLAQPWLIWRVDTAVADIRDISGGRDRLEAFLSAFRTVQDRTAALLANLARLSEDMSTEEQRTTEGFIARVLELAGEQTTVARDLVARGKELVTKGTQAGDPKTQAFGHLVGAIGLLASGETDNARVELTEADSISVPALQPYVHWAFSLSFRIEREIGDALKEASFALQFAYDTKEFEKADLELLWAYARTVFLLASPEERTRFETSVLTIVSESGAKIGSRLTSLFGSDPGAGEAGGG